MSDRVVALTLERDILGKDKVALPCGCIVKIVCTMPVTGWIRVVARLERCLGHPGSDSLWGRDAIANNWVDVDGAIIHPLDFVATFNDLILKDKLKIEGIAEWLNQPCEQILSVEGKHVITKFGRCVPRAGTPEWERSIG